jgi:Holliday junction resolvasome RuvABC endonuclease subunit
MTTDCRLPLVLGVDIGLNNTGWSIANVENNKLSFIDSGCFFASPDIPKNYRYKGTQLVIKGLQIMDQLEGIMSQPFDAVAIETPGGNTQSSAAAKALGASGVLVAYILKHFKGKTVLVKPADVKHCIRQKGKVLKDEVMEHVWNKYTIPNVPTNKDNKYIKKYFEHIADSALVLEAALKTSKLFGGL